MVGNSFIKMVFKFVIIFGSIVWLVFGSIFLSYKFLKGDYSIKKSLVKLGQHFGDKPTINGVVLGTDKSGLRTDTIMFVSYNPNKKKLNVISIPRDTYVPNSVDKKINSVYLKGKEEDVINTIEKIVNQPIEYYLVVKFDGFREIVDEMGGIPIDVPEAMNYHDPYQNLNININKGFQVLNGKDAEGFVRFRSGYANGDLGRIEAQQLFIKAAISHALKASTIPKIPSIINIAFENIKTNVPKGEALKYIDDIIKINKDSIKMERLPGEAKYINGLSYYVHDKQKTESMVESIINDSLSEEEISKRNSNYNIEVLNGTNIPGLATKAADDLRKCGFKIENIDNSEDRTKKTKIIDRNSKKASKFVHEALDFGDILAEYNNQPNIDVTVIIGDDYNK